MDRLRVANESLSTANVMFMDGVRLMRGLSGTSADGAGSIGSRMQLAHDPSCSINKHRSYTVQAHGTHQKH